MRAALLLARADLDTPEVRAALHPASPEEVQVWPAGPLMRRLWRKGIAATTLVRWVFIDPDVLRRDPSVVGKLIIHELVHVRQFSELGLARFFRRYLSDYLRARLRGLDHREAYLQIDLEVEARHQADLLTESPPR